MTDTAKELLAPMTSPVREALETTRRALIALRTRLKTEPAVQGRGWVDLGIVLNNAVDEADRALSAAPGEPCAWRWRWLTGSERDREWSMWTYSATRPTNTTNKVVEPLYSTPQPVAGWDEAIEAAALCASGFDAACNSKRMQPFVDAGLVNAVIDRDNEIASAIKALSTGDEATKSEGDDLATFNRIIASLQYQGGVNGDENSLTVGEIRRAL